MSILKRIIKLISHPGLFAVVNHRFGCWILDNYSSNTKKLVRYFFNFFYYGGKKISVIWGKIDILDGLPIGPGLYLDDKGGIIVGAISIGENCSIFENVTVGMDLDGGKCQLGDNVVIKSNSIVYGPITVADGCVVEQKSVLSKTIPRENAVLKGNPARLIKQ